MGSTQHRRSLRPPGATPTRPRRRLPSQVRSRQDHRGQAGQGRREAEEERGHSQAEEDRGRRRRDLAQGAGEEGRGEAEEANSDYCAGRGICFFTSVDALCEEQPDVLLICSSILSTEAVVRAIPFHKLRPDTIVADVLSVKQFPRNLLLEV